MYENVVIWIDEHLAAVKAVGLLVFWILFGAIVFCMLENVHWIKGLYFAVAACSTGGLAGPSANSDGSIAFVGLFTLLGVPIYAYTLGIFSNVVTAKYLTKKAQENRLGKNNRGKNIYVMLWCFGSCERSFFVFCFFTDN